MFGKMVCQIFGYSGFWCLNNFSKVWLGCLIWMFVSFVCNKMCLVG